MADPNCRVCGGSGLVTTIHPVTNKEALRVCGACKDKTPEDLNPGKKD